MSLRIFLLLRRRALAVGWLQVVSKSQSPSFCVLVFVARGSHTLVCPLFFQRESWMSLHCNMPSIFTGNDVVLEFVLRILLRHADVALRCAHSRCGTLTAVVETCFCGLAPIASSWLVLLWRDKVF